MWGNVTLLTNCRFNMSGTNTKPNPFAHLLGLAFSLAPFLITSFAYKSLFAGALEERVHFKNHENVLKYQKIPYWTRCYYDFYRLGSFIGSGVDSCLEYISSKVLNFCNLTGLMPTEKTDDIKQNFNARYFQLKKYVDVAFTSSSTYSKEILMGAYIMIALFANSLSGAGALLSFSLLSLPLCLSLGVVLNGRRQSKEVLNNSRLKYEDNLSAAADLLASHKKILNDIVQFDNLALCPDLDPKQQINDLSKKMVVTAADKLGYHSDFAVCDRSKKSTDAKAKPAKKEASFSEQIGLDLAKGFSGGLEKGQEAFVKRASFHPRSKKNEPKSDNPKHTTPFVTSYCFFPFYEVASKDNQDKSQGVKFDKEERLRHFSDLPRSRVV
jgi:hypothetical protein